MYKHKSFVYGTARWIKHEEADAIGVPVRPRANSRPICSGCGQKGPGYDHVAERRYQFVPLWGLAVFLLYAPAGSIVPLRRQGRAAAVGQGQEPIDHHVYVVPGGLGEAAVVAGVAKAFGTSWNSVYRSVTLAVLWGIANRVLDGIKAIGIDEIQWQKGHHYLTLVYQIDEGCKRLLYIGRNGPKRACGLLRYAGGEAVAGVAVHLQRHVEAVLEGDCRESRAGGACPGPLPHHGPDEQGHRRGAGR